MGNIREKQVYDLPISNYAKRILLKRGYREINELLKLDYKELKCIPGIGDRTIKEIVDCLLGLGYNLEHKEDLQENIKIKNKPVITLENISINELTDIIVSVMEYNQRLDEINKKKIELLEVYKTVLLEQQQLISKEEQIDKEINETKYAIKSLRRK